MRTVGQEGEAEGGVSDQILTEATIRTRYLIKAAGLLERLEKPANELGNFEPKQLNATINLTISQSNE